MSLNEVSIKIPGEYIPNVFGQFDAFAKKIERTLHVTQRLYRSLFSSSEDRPRGVSPSRNSGKSITNNSARKANLADRKMRDLSLFIG